MRWIMSRATLTTISSPVPPRNAEMRGSMPRLLGNDDRHHRDDAQERRADVRDAHHDLFQVIAVRFPGRRPGIKLP